MRTASAISWPLLLSVPEIEVDENIAPRPEEEIADVARAVPDTTDHAHPGE
ncbi:hypothetical protein [Microbacterium sp. HJ5]